MNIKSIGSKIKGNKTMVESKENTMLKIRSKYKKPAVLIDSYTPKNIARYVNIGLDDEEGGYLMTKYLLNCGHR